MSDSYSHRDKWAAFWLSLAVPGSGQLWAGRWSCLVYFAAVGGLMAAVPRAANHGGVIRGAAMVVLGMLSAEHAKRSLEAHQRRGHATRAAVRSRVLDRSRRGRGIDLRIELDVARPYSEVWVLMADMPNFVTIDPFHSRVIVLGPSLRPGVELALEHRAFGATFLRFGRLLSWREGRGYTFSDLSARHGARGFFPHVFDFAVEPAGADGPGSARLTVRVRGRWTSHRIPRWVGRWWFRYVCCEHARLLRAALA